MNGSFVCQLAAMFHTVVFRFNQLCRKLVFGRRIAQRDPRPADRCDFKRAVIGHINAVRRFSFKYAFTGADAFKCLIIISDGDFSRYRNDATTPSFFKSSVYAEPGVRSTTLNPTYLRSELAEVTSCMMFTP